MSKDAFSKADEHKKKKEMELFISLLWAITPVICISIIIKNMEKMEPISHLYHIILMQNLCLFVAKSSN